MRKIKFRVRDVAQNSWRNFLYVDVLTWQAAGDKREYIYQQFTGLTDKNGREIYEGDILEDNFSQYKAEFYNGAFLLVDICNEMTPEKIFKEFDIEEIPFIYRMNVDKMLIVGNIFEK